MTQPYEAIPTTKQTQVGDNEYLLLANVNKFDKNDLITMSICKCLLYSR